MGSHHTKSVNGHLRLLRVDEASAAIAMEYDTCNFIVQQHLIKKIHWIIAYIALIFPAMPSHVCGRSSRFSLLTLTMILVALPAFAAEEPTLRLLGENLLTIDFIGDLHGDVGCARRWISRTGAAVVDANGTWSWTGGADHAIVFLGDYVDKGPDGRGVLELVRGLEAAFPANIVAMMGNHDLFALLDASLSPAADRPMGIDVGEYVYAFTHPQVRSSFSRIHFTRLSERKSPFSVFSWMAAAFWHVTVGVRKSLVSETRRRQRAPLGPLLGAGRRVRRRRGGARDDAGAARACVILQGRLGASGAGASAAGAVAA